MPEIQRDQNSFYKRIVPNENEDIYQTIAKCTTCLYYQKFCDGMTLKRGFATITKPLRPSEVEKFIKDAPCLKTP